ncbi:MAG: Gfo/Idh/MocA family oxidoreductase [Phycicoccus sp.]
MSDDLEARAGSMRQAEADAVLRVAVVGCGRATGQMEGFGIGYAHADAWRALPVSVELFGVDIDPANLAAFAEHYGLSPGRAYRSTDALYADVTPDFVSVCVWPGLHARLVVEAAEAGVRGILCEKPLALNVVDLETMQAACREHGVVLATAHQRRYNPYVEWARSFLDQGGLGPPYVLEARVGDGWDVLSWATHWFDLANFLFGAEPEWVLAGAEIAGSRRYGHLVEDGSVALAQYPGGSQAVFVTGPDNPHLNPITVRGTDGMLRLFEDQDAEVFDRRGYETIRPAAVREGRFDLRDYRSGFRHLVEDLVVSTGRHTTSRCDVGSTAAATQTALAVHESARVRRRVHLPLDTGFTPLDVLHEVPTPTVRGSRALLYCDDHFGSGGPDGLQEALAAVTGQPVATAPATEPLDEEALATTDVLCLYHTQATADDATQSALVRWVEGGGPTLLVHAAVGAYPTWSEYGGWSGYRWNWETSSHPHEPCVMVPAEGDPLGFGWASAWLPRDEIYVGLDRVSDTVDGLRTDVAGATHPLAWTTAGYPHVGCWLPGHRRDSWQVPAMRQGLATVMARIVRDEDA